MDWIILSVAGVFEIVWAAGLKFTEGFTRLWPSLGTVVAMAISMALLAQALKTIPVGTGYAVWTGIGAFGTAVVGILFFKDPATFWRLTFLTTLIGSLIGLKYVS